MLHFWYFHPVALSVVVDEALVTQRDLGSILLKNIIWLNIIFIIWLAKNLNPEIKLRNRWF